MTDSLLYPVNNASRTSLRLDGLWKFAFDPESKGEREGWYNRLPSSIDMPVPSSFADLFTDHKSRDYTGDFWYQTSFYVPADGDERKIVLRFGSVTHRAVVYLNGTKITEHEGGYLPFNADITDFVKKGEENLLSVKGNNELSETSLPCGALQVKKDGTKIARPYFDFFNYAGIQRSVWLQRIPNTSISDFNTNTVLKGKDADLEYEIFTEGKKEENLSYEAVLKDAEGNTAAVSQGAKGSLHVSDARLWKVRNAYLYALVLTVKDSAGNLVDTYSQEVGLRTIRIEGVKILVNEEPVYLKGFGKHEDFMALGKTFNWSLAKRDYECMKWINANCFRTSHYPYAEEWYQFADREGFLIIDEVPAVGMMRSTHNFVAAGMGKYTYFFETPTVPQLLTNHKNQVREMIQRDKNHPSVFAWSLFNEPETTSKQSHDYFKEVFDSARPLDPQARPLTGALEKNSSPEKCQCYMLCDFLCLNRYYGWYISGGDLEEAEEKFRNELDRWAEKKLNVPVVFTEFGTDTLPELHKLPSIMWSQEYQNEYYEMNFSVFDDYDFIQGELTWNFADFRTSEGIFRVDGNKKGIFTRDRQPKEAAFLLKKRWETKQA
jgi:beta-glucuronidase